MTTITPERVRTFPVVETFGPTIQGEGPDAGLAATFIRLGGCDFRCSWCDSMYAVDPAQVRDATRMTTNELFLEIAGTLAQIDVVVLSGGNPALHECGDLVDLIHDAGARVSIETQGTVWRPWLADTDLIVISPKGPSSGMNTIHHRAQSHAFMRAAARANASLALKFVIFDSDDFRFAETFTADHPGIPLYLSAGTPQYDPMPNVDVLRRAILERYRWLCETLAHHPALVHARVLPQLHVLAWGAERGR
jgi:7-carboxy-7-deazaguanine synthase